MKKLFRLLVSGLLSSFMMFNSLFTAAALDSQTVSEADFVLPVGADVGITAEEVSEEEMAKIAEKVKVYEELDYYEDSQASSITASTNTCYYYSQLTAAQKQLYNNLLTEAKKVWNTTTTYSDGYFCTIDRSALTFDEMSEAFVAFYYDHPELFFLVHQYSYSSSMIAPYINSTLKDATVRNNYADKINTVVNQWLPEINKGANDFEKEKIIYEKICNSVDYVFTDRDQCMAGALVDKQCVCNGYAMTFSYLAGRAGLPSTVIVGQNHAWNAVKLDGTWYSIDVTWMDQGSYIWTDWCNISQEQLLKQDTQYGKNSHTIDTQYYINVKPPKTYTYSSVKPVTPKVTATAGDGSVKLTWPASSGAIKYSVYSYLNGSYTQHAVTTGTSYTVTGLKNGTTYGFLVRAGSSTSWSDFTAADRVTATPTAASAKPVTPKVTATAGDGCVTLKWPASTGATKYAVYSYLNGSYTQQAVTTATTYKVTGLKNGTTYGFLVRAGSGTYWSSFTASDRVTATPTAASAKPVTPKVTATAGDGCVTLKWPAATGATKYAVYSYLNGSYTQHAVTTATTYKVTGLKNGTTYGFLVRAGSGTYWSSFTASDRVTATPTAASAKPVTPKVTATAGDGCVTLKWPAATGATKYAVYSYLNGSYTQHAVTTGTTYKVTGLKNGTTYGFLVRAGSGTYWSSFTASDRVSATPVTSKPSTPKVTATAGDGCVTLKWSAPAGGAAKYAVYSYLNGSYTQHAVTTGTSYTVTGLTNGTTYGFLVRAGSGTYWSTFTASDRVSATPVTSKPSTPKVTAKAGNGSVTLTWSAPAGGAAKYAVYSYVNGSYTQHTVTTGTTFTVTGLTNGTSYGFLVRAGNGTYWSTYSSSDLVYATPNA